MRCDLTDVFTHLDNEMAEHLADRLWRRNPRKDRGRHRGILAADDTEPDPDTGLAAFRTVCCSRPAGVHGRRRASPELRARSRSRHPYLAPRPRPPQPLRAARVALVQTTSSVVRPPTLIKSCGPDASRPDSAEAQAGRGTCSRIVLPERDGIERLLGRHPGRPARVHDAGMLRRGGATWRRSGGQSPPIPPTASTPPSCFGPYLDERRFDLLLDNCWRFLAGRPLRNLVDKASWF